VGLSETLGDSPNIENPYIISTNNGGGEIIIYSDLPPPIYICGDWGVLYPLYVYGESPYRVLYRGNEGNSGNPY
jgi:hypothetical protein